MNIGMKTLLFRITNIYFSVYNIKLTLLKKLLEMIFFCNNTSFVPTHKLLYKNIQRFPKFEFCYLNINDNIIRKNSIFNNKNFIVRPFSLEIFSYITIHGI